MAKNRFLVVLFVLLFLGPLYQWVDAQFRNSKGDGVIVYGQYTIYRPFIGYKTENYSSWTKGWEKDSVVFYSPLWMKLLGVDEKVVYSKTEDNKSSFFQRAWSFTLRWIMKILIPGIFFILYYRKLK